MSVAGSRDDGAAVRARIRALHRAAGRRLVVLDDDPTGSQSVNGATVVTTRDPTELLEGLAEPGSTCFVLTNTRSLDERDAIALNVELARTIFSIESELGGPIEIVSRSDSTLRGHLLGEVGALTRTRRELGEGYDGVVFVPAFLEAGRFTRDNVHYAVVGGVETAVGETEFARDATFGYRSSDLRDLLVEKSAGAITRDEIATVSLGDIRDGGPERIAEILASSTPDGFVVVNATEFADLEQVALALFEVIGAKRRYLFRSGPSLVRALSGNEPRPPLQSGDIYPGGRPTGHGLVVIGSHVGLTNAQLAVAREQGGLEAVELDAVAIADAPRRDAVIAKAITAVSNGLAASDVVLFTSRVLRTGADAQASLAIARSVSDALVEVVRGALSAAPAFVLAKGGITSHDLAVRALEIRRASVLGQLRTGMVSVFRPLDARGEAIGIPFVVFAGNVGDEQTLAQVITVLRGAS